MGDEDDDLRDDPIGSSPGRIQRPMKTSSPSDSTSIEMSAISSQGGVSLRLPDSWVQIGAGEHLGAFLAPEEVRDAAGFTPNVVINDAAGHVTLADWWQSLSEVGDLALLMEAAASDEAASAVFAHVISGVSVTGCVRLQHLPGRTVFVTVQFASAASDRWLGLAAEICGSLEVEGLA